MHKPTKANHGFTIIEVVITIAIGAAVMALVLNAVAGARRSQRNNARSADVNAIAAGVNQYIATRNAIPTNLRDIATILENGDKFGHYDGISCTTATPPVCTSDSINDANAWGPNSPGAGVIPTPAASHSANTIGISGSSCSIVATPAHNQAACTAPAVGGTWITNTGSPPTTGTIGGSGADAFDHVVIIQQAACANNQTIASGGLREMVITYRLEGQDAISCLEV